MITGSNQIFVVPTNAKLALAQCREAARLVTGMPLFDQLVRELVFELSYLNDARATERLVAVVTFRQYALLAIRHLVAPEPDGLSDLEIEGFVAAAMASALDALSLMPATVGHG